MINRVFFFALAICLVCDPVFSGDLPIAVDVGKSVPASQWTDYQGREWKSSEFSKKKATVYAFIGTQ
jgi:hypothetical protein